MLKLGRPAARKCVLLCVFDDVVPTMWKFGLVTLGEFERGQGGVVSEFVNIRAELLLGE